MESNNEVQPPGLPHQPTMKREEEDIIPVELVDEVDRFEDEFGEDEAVTI